MLSLLLANNFFFWVSVDSISCCTHLNCCKLLRKGFDVLSTSFAVWHLYELDLPALLPKET